MLNAPSAASFRQTSLAAAVKRAMHASLSVVVSSIWTAASDSLPHLIHRCQQIGAQVFIKIDPVLHSVGIDNYPIGHWPAIVLLHQIAVRRQLHYVVFIGLLCPATLDLHRNQAAAFALHNVIRLAADWRFF